VDPDELCSEAELQAFLEKALLSHAERDSVVGKQVPEDKGKDRGNANPGENTDNPLPPKPKKPRPAGGKDSPLGRIIQDKKPEGET